MSAEVGLLTRKFQIIGTAEATEVWGCTVQAVSFVDFNSGNSVSGQITLKGTEFVNCSQDSTEKGALMFINTKTDF